ncbi:MAG: hypothetical protein N2036_13830 [Bryobacteraceae bacterium]|nr:hypothetical protein [Bryobacteraceae bacterium]
MICAALLLALAAPAAPVQTVFDDAVEIPPGQVRTLAIPVRSAPLRVACSWAVRRGAPARLVLLPAEEVDAWVQHKPHMLLAASGLGRSGSLSFVARAPSELVLVLETGSGAREMTHLRLLVRLMDPSIPFPVRPRPAERRRGEILVWGSLCLFAVAAGLSAARIRRNFRRRAHWTI